MFRFQYAFLYASYKDAQIQYLVIQEKVVSTLLLFHILD